MPITQKPVIKRYLCTTFDGTQFITDSIECEIIWQEKASIRFPIRGGPILAKKLIWVPEYSIAYGISWRPLERWIAIKEFIELDESN